MSEFLVPQQAKHRGSVLVIHSLWGLTDSFRDIGRFLAGHGFVVCLSDLYGGRTARTEAEAGRLRAAPRKEPMYKALTRDIRDLQIKARSAAPVGIAGFSMGGHWAVWLSQQPVLPIASVALFYAARGGDFSESKASFMAHFGGRDEWITPSARRRMESQLLAAKRPYRAFDYPGAGHWFAESARPLHYFPEACGIALSRTLAHFEATLRT